VKMKSAAERKVTYRVLTAEDWPVVVRLFGDRGACGGCWCMYWRIPRGGRLWEELKGQKNRDAFRRQVRDGKVHAILGFAGREPVAWCSFGPRHSFPRLETVRALKRNWSEGTWSIVCFYIQPRWRGHGVATTLLEMAVDHAFACGAQEVEGYPVVPKLKPMPAAFAWTGVPAVFRNAGLKRMRRPGESRPIYIKRRTR